jgi:cytidylate kinase
MLDMQRDVAKKNNVIMDGRDIGTVVLPRANVKIFLTASVEIRAKRRYDELIAKGTKADLNKIQEEIRQRDHQDITRPIAPLKQAKDAILVDTSNMTINEVITTLQRIIKEKIPV